MMAYARVALRELQRVEALDREVYEWARKTGQWPDLDLTWERRSAREYYRREFVKSHKR